MGNEGELKHRDYRTPTKVDDLPLDQWLALFDLDGTLTEPGSKLVLQYFVSNDSYAIGNPEERIRLKKIFSQWNTECDESPNTITHKRYESHLTRVGNSYAMMCQSLKRGNMIEHAENWYKNAGRELLMPYAKEVINVVKEQGLCPALVTGAPFELAYWFADDLDIRHLFSMEAEVDGSDTYTGQMKRDKNMGLNANKVRSRVAISNTPSERPIAFSMGDTRSDNPLHRGSIESHHPKDPRGKGILINPTSVVLEGMEAHYTEYINGRDLIVISPEAASMYKENVVGIVRDTIRDVVESKKNAHLENNPRNKKG
jgi:HAD superfamily phosphoserine phosphatase-like hydrolase